MTTQAGWTTHSDARGTGQGEVRSMARQPILDRHGRLHGYELFLRSDARNTLNVNTDQVTRVLVDSAVLFGFEQLACSQPAFIRCSAQTLAESMVEILPAGMTILHLDEAEMPTAELASVCKKLKAAGFRKFGWESDFEPLLNLANYIKVDLTQTTALERQSMRASATRTATALVAEKVETQADYQLACDEGFGFFQGYYFCRPELFKKRKIPANRLAHIKIIQMLHHEPMDLHAVSMEVKQDTSLTYRLLRLVNSPVSALRQEVRSIESALMVVGEDMFRRIATLAITTELNGSQSPEILRMAFVRGRFCELAAEPHRLDPTEQYLLGLLSLLPAMLCMPMDELTPSLPLRDAIQKALHGTPNKERRLLDWMEHHERGEWAACDALTQANGMDRDGLLRIYGEAVQWAEEALHSVV